MLSHIYLPHLSINSIRMCDKSQEARRIMLSDINFTSMVPELSRSADHLCQEEDAENHADESSPMATAANNGNSSVLASATQDYYKGPCLKTPDYSNRGYIYYELNINYTVHVL